MALNLIIQDDGAELKPRITVFGVGGAGGNAVNNMIDQQLEGVEFVVANTDAQALAQSRAPHRVQLGARVTEGLGAGAKPQIGAAAAEESIEQIVDHLAGVHMCFITAGMGGGTGTGAAPIIAQAAREMGVLTVGVVTKPFAFEGGKRMRQAEDGVEALQKVVDTLIIIPNQNLFRLANERTTFTEAFALADDVLYQGVKGVTDLMVRPGLINLDFADVRSVMDEMGKAMMGTGEASGDNRAVEAAEKAIANPLLDEISLNGARGVLINITGGYDMTLFELDEAAGLIREKVDPDANIIVGSTLDPDMSGVIRVSVVATGIDAAQVEAVAAPPRATGMPLTTPPVSTPAPVPAPAPAAVAPAAAAPVAPEPAPVFRPVAEPPARTAADPVAEDIPPPSYRPEPPAPAAAPAAAAPARPVPPTVNADPGVFVAPRPPVRGNVSEEVQERLRQAVAKGAAHGAPQPQSQVQAQSATRNDEPQRRRFGLGGLIDRMTSGDAASTGAAAARSQPQPPAHAAFEDEADSGQGPVELPAFLRRQAN